MAKAMYPEREDERMKGESKGWKAVGNQGWTEIICGSRCPPGFDTNSEALRLTSEQSVEAPKKHGARLASGLNGEWPTPDPFIL